MKTISFNAPHWELVCDGKLRLGEYDVKTRNDDYYKHRGAVVCYTLKTAHMGACKCL